MHPKKPRSHVAAPAVRLFAVSMFMFLWLCAPELVAFGQSSTSETLGNDSHRSSRHPNFDSHSMGICLSKTLPVYPPAAIAAGISGTVVIEATISETGVVADAHVLNGPAILEQESLKAVRSWRYRPYLPNGAPTIRKIKMNLIFMMEQDGRATIQTTESKPEIVKTPSQAEDFKLPRSK